MLMLLCLHDIKAWMALNVLNLLKTEAMAQLTPVIPPNPEEFVEYE